MSYIRALFVCVMNKRWMDLLGQSSFMELLYLGPIHKCLKSIIKSFHERDWSWRRLLSCKVAYMTMISETNF